MKRVRIQSAHGILIPGGLPNSPRRAMWRSRQQTLTYLAAALTIYGLLCTTRNILRQSDLGGNHHIPNPSDLDQQHPPPQPYLYETTTTTTTANSVTVTTDEDCPEYAQYAMNRHGPSTGGTFDLPYQRPSKQCRKVIIPEVEEVIQEMNQTIKDPDLFRLFENAFPNTMDTSIAWMGVSKMNMNEELTFITTGDIHAMWLRDSANQLQSYVSLLKPPSKDTTTTGTTGTTTTTATSRSKLASIFRGAINLQSRYILASPHCNAFQPPVEANMPWGNDGNPHDIVFPPYDTSIVFECKYELDSLAAFLQLSWDYFDKTKDIRFFLDASISSSSILNSAKSREVEQKKKNTKKNKNAKNKKGTKRRPRSQSGTDGWKDAVLRILETAEDMRQSTYRPDGIVPDSPYRFERVATASTETLSNRGNGSPVRAGTGLIRSAFRPSDDACTFQFLVPANMMLARYLELNAEIMAKVEKEEERLIELALRSREAQEVLKAQEEEEGAGKEGGGEGEEEKEEEEEYYRYGKGVNGEDYEGESIAERMRRFAKEIKQGVEKYGKVKHPDFGEIYAYEVDGYRSANMMDDANLPSLLSSPLTGYVKRTDSVYRATRKFALSTANPYYDHGPVINGTGGPHIGPGMVWPMSLIVGIMTTDDDDEIKDMLRQILSSTDGLGLIHESINVYNQGMWTRSWFSWANGLFGQMILDLKERKPHILKTSFQ